MDGGTFSGESGGMDAALRANVESQLERLLSQLEDLEELREDLDDDEYAATKEDTLAQLKEFQASLAKMASGSMTLQSNLEATRLAVQAAVSSAFQTPEVIRLFASKQPAAMRRRLAEMERDVKLCKLEASSFDSMKSEMLVALKKLGEKLTPSEEAFLSANKSASLSEFEAVDDNDEQVSQLPASLA